MGKAPPKKSKEAQQRRNSEFEKDDEHVKTASLSRERQTQKAEKGTRPINVRRSGAFFHKKGGGKQRQKSAPQRLFCLEVRLHLR